MLNLLPLVNKEKNRKEYYVRVVIVFLFLMFFTGLFSIIYYIPSYFNNKIKKNDISHNIDILRESLALRSDDLSLKNLNFEIEKLAILNENGNDVDFNETLREVIDKKLQGIHIVGFFYERQNTAKTLILRGVADTRDGLVDFSKSLESVSNFSKIDLPVSNLVKEKDADFLIKITLK